MADTPAPENSPAPPPAAPAVATGTKTERELDLEKQIEAERAACRRVETEHAHLADENLRLKTVVPPTPPAKRKAAPNTFFDEPSESEA